MAGWVPYSKWKEAATLSLTNNKSKPLELSKKGKEAPQPSERADQTPHDPTGSRVSVYPAFEKLFRFIPSLERAKNYQTYADDLLAKGFPEVSRHIANEAVNGRLRDAVPYYCGHGFSQWTERWFVETVEVQLRFSRCYRID
jgi:hypothetical protein